MRIPEKLEVWGNAPNALSIAAGASVSVFLSIPPIPIVRGQVLKIWNASASMSAASAADSRKVVCDAASIFCNLLDQAGNIVMGGLNLATLPWSPGSAIPFSTGLWGNGLVIALIGDPAFELVSNLSVAPAANLMTAGAGIVSQAQIQADLELRNTDGAAAHSVDNALIVALSR